MAATSLSKLVAELSTEERGALLSRIKMAMPVSSEPLYPLAALGGAAAAVGLKVDDFGFMAKLLLFLRGLFSGKTREELLREDELKDIGRRVELRQAGLVDRRRALLLGVMAEELRGLKDAARFFYEALDHSVEKDKGAFYFFLGSIELPETHERLLAEADPAAIAATILEARGEADDSAVRSAALAAYERIFSDLSDKGRRAMYQDLRSVLFLKRLAGFLFDRLLGAFKEAPLPESGLMAPFVDARDLLLELGDILLSMSEPPSNELMEAIFMFADEGELGKPGADAAAAIGSDIAKAETALGRIRTFHKRVPLGDILRLVAGDPRYQPRELPGGEDWLALYKAFWRERIDAALDEWRKERRNKELVEEMAAFVGEPGPAGFAHISREERDYAPALRLDTALAFLDAFFRGPFVRDLNRPLKIVLVDGEFYRKDNRVEYTDAYDAIIRIPELLAALDGRLAPTGEISQAWVAAKGEMGPVAIKRRKMQAIARSAEEEAERIIRREGNAFRTMINILKGFLKGEAGGRYDSLANLSYIDGKSNKDFQRSLDRAKDRCEKGLSLLAELSGLDLSSGE